MRRLIPLLEIATLFALANPLSAHLVRHPCVIPLSLSIQTHFPHPMTHAAVFPTHVVTSAPNRPPVTISPMDPLLAWRKEFPILANTVYMVSHSLGAMPRRAQQRLAEYADVWASRGVRAWHEGWWELPVTTGDLLGRILGAAPGEITMQPNVSLAQAIIHSCLDFPHHRNRIVTDALNFPTNHYLFHALESVGAEVVTVPSRDGLGIETEDLLAAIDHRTRLVAVSHVLFRTSYLQDLAAIATRAHEAGALIAADLYQSAGTVPINVRELGLDFATGGSVKWLCGGPGAGYLYVRRELWPTLEPKLTGWMAHEQPFAFSPGPQRYAPDAFRFLHGTPNIPGLYAARSGYEIIEEVGVEAIRAKSIRQTGRLLELAREAGFTVKSPLAPARRGGVVTLDVPDGQNVVDELARRDILVDYRPGSGIRVAPHFYTDDAELDATIAAIRELVPVRAL
jgi:kynureninase